VTCLHIGTMSVVLGLETNNDDQRPSLGTRAKVKCIPSGPRCPGKHRAVALQGPPAGGAAGVAL